MSLLSRRCLSVWASFVFHFLIEYKRISKHLKANQSHYVLLLNRKHPQNYDGRQQTASVSRVFLLDLIIFSINVRFIQIILSIFIEDPSWSRGLQHTVYDEDYAIGFVQCFTKRSWFIIYFVALVLSLPNFVPSLQWKFPFAMENSVSTFCNIVVLQRNILRVGAVG